jgi:hypothetical protein
MYQLKQQLGPTQFGRTVQSQAQNLFDFAGFVLGY